MREQLHEQLAQLRLRGIAAALDAEIARAEQEGTPLTAVLGRLFAAQEGYQREQRLAYRLTQAKLPWRWTLDSFPFARQPVSTAPRSVLSPDSTSCADRRTSY